jgi:hypothetical protein
MNLAAGPDSLAIPTWIGAIATVVLAIFAVVTAVYARRAFLQQADELRLQQELSTTQTEVLELQAQDLRESLAERKREASERRRSQAEQVVVGIDRPALMAADIPDGSDAVVVVSVRNTSPRALRGVQCHWYRNQRLWGGPDLVTRLMPGEQHTFSRHLPHDLKGNSDLRIFKAEILFRDAARVLWRIRDDGSIEELGPGEPTGQH